MQSFEMPDFYVPWPARCNPNLEIARKHSKEWAIEIGILGASQDDDSPQIWDEHSFDRHDYALFCAYIHPEAPSYELNLMTDWNTWAFYVDDFFLQVYKKSKDRVGARKYLDRVLLFMPVELTTVPAPTNPTERGLADLWFRTAPSKSEAWRDRIIESTRRLLEESILELENMIHQRLANPIEYIEMRRRVGGAMWSADLVEHAVFVEIPERIADTRPMRVLKDTFADAVHLRNDIFSYEREVKKDGELTNGILVIERFLDVETQRAVNLINDLLTSRLQQFEHTAITELAPLFAGYGLDPLEQANVLLYLRGLQDWQSGAHEWHIQTSRYLNPQNRQTSDTRNFFLPGFMGLGTSAARITSAISGLNRFKKYMHTPYHKVDPTQLPEFYMPFTSELNPHLDNARQCSKGWARKMGMLDSLPNHSDVFIWDEQKLDAADVAFFCALAYPNATANQLAQAACWLVWATYTDDYFADVYGHTRDLAGAKAFHTRLSEFMPLDGVSNSSLALIPAERGLADLWTQTAMALSLDVRILFRETIENLIASWLWELTNRIQNRILDPIDYVEMRRKTSGADFMLVFIRSVEGKDGIPAEIYSTRTMQELNNAAGDHVYLANDIVSYQKEIEFEGDLHNGVLVVQNFLGCDRIEAVDVVNKLMTARVKQFEHIVAIELPILFENFNLDASAREQLLGHVKDLQHLMFGSLQWHTNVGRYKEFELCRRLGISLPNGPTGLGTVGAKVLTMVGRSTTETAIPLPAQTEEAHSEVSNGLKTFAASHLAPLFLTHKEEAPTD